MAVIEALHQLHRIRGHRRDLPVYLFALGRRQLGSDSRFCYGALVVLINSTEVNSFMLGNHYVPAASQSDSDQYIHSEGG